MQIDYHSDLKEVQRDARLCRLLSDERQSAPFDRLDWWQALVQHCGLTPLLAVASSPHGQAVLPLAGRSGHLVSLSNWYTFRFRPLLEGDAPLEALARDLGRKAHRVTLTGMPDEDGSASTTASAFEAAGWVVIRTRCDTNHVLPLQGRDYGAYFATRPGPLRTTLKRKSNKVATSILENFDPAAWDQYEAIYAQSWKPEEGSPAFLRAFAQAEGKAGRLRFALAHAADDPAGPAIAAQMWTVERGTAFIHKLAHREDAKPLSPGSVLTAALMRHVIDLDKVELVDFGTGDDPYKRDWMEEQRPRWRLDMFRPWQPVNWPQLAKIGLRSLAATAKRS